MKYEDHTLAIYAFAIAIMLAATLYEMADALEGIPAVMEVR